MKSFIKYFCGVSFLLLLCQIISAQDSEKKSCLAIKTDSEPTINGILNDPEWDLVEWQGEFIQYDPYNGAEPGQETCFKVLYDNNNLYVAICAFDDNPDSINYRLTRRDIYDGDYIAFTLDTYHDHNTAYAFYINASGVKSDEFYYDNGESSDLSWNPVWYGKTSSDSLGWYAEMKIPLSQLRFENDTSLTWGLSVMRRIFRYSETDLWVPLPKDAPGWVHLMGEINNIKVNPRRQFDITPYAKSSIGPNNNFDGSVGVDGKAAISNNLIMDYTVNPDFGQVEADPSVVNLSVYETYFEEKRPFFIEGQNITSFPVDLGNDLDNLFYSRRIGRRPRNIPRLEANDSLVFPNATSILGAAKITGKNNNGFSLGMIEGVTAQEYAKIINGDDIRKLTSEPLTNYFVGRVNKEYNKGETEIGGIFTATNRAIGSDSSVFWIPESSYTGGVNFTRTFDNRNYQFDANLYFSHVSGKKEAISKLQLSPVRYFQRPDADHIQVDTSRTSLTGTGGNVSFSKSGKGHLNYLAYFRWNSPQLELNDVGYLRESDLATQIFWMGYHIWEPKGILKDLDFNLTQWSSWNFGAQNSIIGFNFSTRFLFINNWSLILMGNRNFNISDHHLLRGGPSYRLNRRGLNSLTINSDNRKSLYAALSLSTITSKDNLRKGNNILFELSYKPSERLNIGVNPSYSVLTNKELYVATVKVDSETKYILGKIHQKTLSTSIRVNYTFLPDLSIEYWGQPFVSKGKYSEFKEVISPDSRDYNNRFLIYSESKVSHGNDMYALDIDQDGSTDFEFNNPDFTVREFLSNLVLRWEFQPGSTAYLVWNQTRSDCLLDNKSGLVPEIRTLFGSKANNVFLVKLSFRFGR